MENEADMYHASANVSTLLLKLGEASRKFHSSLDEAATSARLAKLKTRSDDNLVIVEETATATTSLIMSRQSDSTASFDSYVHTASNDRLDDVTVNESDDVNETKSGEAAAASTSKWSVSFEQLIASLLNEDLLVKYFDTKYDLDAKLAEYKTNHA